MMEYLPSNLITRAGPPETKLTAHLELRADTTSTTRVKVTMTVEEVASTLFATKVGTSVSTMTQVPQSLIDEAANEAAAESSSQMAAVASMQAMALAHSSVTGLLVDSTITTTSSIKQPAAQIVHATTATPVVAVSNTTSPLPVGFHTTGSRSSSAIPIGGLELRSDSDATTSTSHVQTPSATNPSTVRVVAVVYGSSTSIMDAVDFSTLTDLSRTIASISATESSETTPTLQTPSTAPTDPTTQSTTAQTKSTQSALIRTTAAVSTPSDIDDSAASTTMKTGCLGVCTPSPSTSSPRSGGTSLTSDSQTLVLTTSSISSSTPKVYTFPITTTSEASVAVTSTSASASVSASSSSSEVSAAEATAYGASGSDVGADNAAGASGDDGGSFKLSKGGFAAVISVVSVGVGLGSTFLFPLSCFECRFVFSFPPPFLSKTVLPCIFLFGWVQPTNNPITVIFLILFVIAKRRQWHVRETLKRQSRRLTSRFHPSSSKSPLNEKGRGKGKTKGPILPTIQPCDARSPLMGPRAMGTAGRRAYVGIDAQLAESGYQGVQNGRGRGSGSLRGLGMAGGVGNVSGARGPEAWRREMGVQAFQRVQGVGGAMAAGAGATAGVGAAKQQPQRKKPELRVDTNLARDLESGVTQKEKQRKRGSWRELFRAL